MRLFGNIWGPSGGARPNGLMVSFVNGTCKFFLGDRWILIGKVFLVQNSAGIRPILPNINEFFNERRHLDDGSDEWRRWGPRLN